MERDERGRGGRGERGERKEERGERKRNHERGKRGRRGEKLRGRETSALTFFFLFSSQVPIADSLSDPLTEFTL